MSELSDLLERFRRGPELLAMATTGAAGSMLDFRIEGHLSIRQIVCHLADAEAVGAVALRQILAENEPRLPAPELEQWSKAIDYGQRKISHALETFRRLRADNHELLSGLPDESFARTGLGSGGNAVSLRTLAEQMAAHMEDQVREIQAVRAAYKEHRAQQVAAQASTERS